MVCRSYTWCKGLLGGELGLVSYIESRFQGTLRIKNSSLFLNVGPTYLPFTECKIVTLGT